jgi:uncharacterized membrane protein YphA (DoxX/SURF4 family)
VGGVFILNTHDGLSDGVVWGDELTDKSGRRTLAKAFAYREYYSMFMSFLFLLVVGAGWWSLDALLSRHGTADPAWLSKGHG